jgi:hypothetical protein
MYSYPSLLIKLTALVWEQENTILPSESIEHPVMVFPLMFIFCFNFNCILSTDMGGDRSATIIWACLSSSGGGVNRCIAIIDRESQKVMTTISMDTYIYGMAV